MASSASSSTSSPSPSSAASGAPLHHHNYHQHHHHQHLQDFQDQHFQDHQHQYQQQQPHYHQHHHHHHQQQQQQQLHHHQQYLHDTANAPFSRPPSHLASAASSPPSRLASWATQSHWAPYMADMAPPFTAGMRDRQARGKDPYLPETTLPAAIAHRTPSMARMPPAKHPKEPFQRTERRDWAETVLDNPELLMMYAHSSGDTLPVTRLRFKKIMCGLDDYDDEDLSTPDLCPPTTAPGAAYYAQGHPQQRSKSAQQHSLGRRSAANTGGVLRGLRP